MIDIFIPARLGSTRLPGKVLLDVAGRPLIHYTIEAAKKVPGANVTVLTEDMEIFEAVAGQCDVAITGPFNSGTERIAWYVQNHKINNVIVNWQADEPLINPDNVASLANIITWTAIPIGTLAAADREYGLYDSNIVKVVVNKNQHAMYFSRSPIPWDGTNMLHHIGIYVFSPRFIGREINKLGRNLYKGEHLEQLHWLENGTQIYVQSIKTNSFGIDTQKDLEKLRSIKCNLQMNM